MPVHRNILRRGQTVKAKQDSFFWLKQRGVIDDELAELAIKRDWTRGTELTGLLEGKNSKNPLSDKIYTLALQRSESYLRSTAIEELLKRPSGMRQIERAIPNLPKDLSSSVLLKVLSSAEPTPGLLDLAVKSGDMAVMKSVPAAAHRIGVPGLSTLEALLQAKTGNLSLEKTVRNYLRSAGKKGKAVLKRNPQK